VRAIARPKRQKSKNLCPYGNVNDDGKPKWNAKDAKANADYAAVFLMR